MKSACYHQPQLCGPATQPSLLIRLVILALTQLTWLCACSGPAPSPDDRVRDSPDEAVGVDTALAGAQRDVVFASGDSSNGWVGNDNVGTDVQVKQQGAASLISVGSGTDRFRNDNLPELDAREMRYLSFWYYISDASGIRRDRDAQVELSSSALPDENELSWNLHALNLHDGWNFVRLPLGEAANNGADLSAVRRFRLYHYLSEPVTTRLDDVRFSKDLILDLGESNNGWWGSDTVGTHATKVQGDASLHSTGSGTDRFRNDDLPLTDASGLRYLTFWYYISDATKIRADRDAQVELSSNSSLDREEHTWNVHSLDLQTGWNFIRLDLQQDGQGGADLSAIRRFRLYHYVTAPVTTHLDDVRFMAGGRDDCTLSTADKTVKGSGTASTGSTYGSLDCDSRFVVSLVPYAPADQSGTVVASTGPNPADTPRCTGTQLSAEVWRRNPNTGEYEALESRSGAHRVFTRGSPYTTESGEPRCRRPMLLLDLEFPEFLPGGDYRVAFGVFREAEAGLQLGEAALVTPPVPETPISEYAELRQLLNATAATAFAQEVNLQPQPARDLSCRAVKIDMLLLERAAPAMAGVGAAENSISAYVDARRHAVDLLCGESFGSPNFVGSYRDALQEVSTTLGEIVEEVAASVFPDNQDMAVGLLDHILTDVTKTMLDDCAADRDALFGMLFDPNGSIGSSSAFADSLFPSCGGSGGGSGGSTRRETVAEIADALVSGRGMAGTFGRCVNDAMAKEIENSECNDPRADVETPLESDAVQRCMEGKDPVQDADAVNACISAEQRWRERREEEEAAEAAAEVADPGFTDCKDVGENERTLCTLAEDYLNSDAVMSPEQIRNWRIGTSWGSRILSRIFVGPFKPFKNLFKATIQGGAAGIAGATLVHESELRKYCEVLPGHDKCVALREMDRGGKLRCIGENLGGVQATYLTSGEFSSGQEQPMTMFDRLDACYCEYFGGPVFGADCMSPEERERQRCLAPGDDDGPRTCFQHLHTDEMNETETQAAVCHYVTPDPDCVGLIGEDSQCLCLEEVDPVELQAAIDREVCGQAYCDPTAITQASGAVFDLRTQCCQHFEGAPPSAPPGPGCIDNPFADVWQSFDLDAVIPARIENVSLLSRDLSRSGLERDVSLYRSGYTSAVGPLITRDAFPDLQRVTTERFVNLDVEVLRSQDAACDEGRVEAYCTSAQMENEPLGQAPITDIPPGQFGELHIEVPRSALDRCIPETGGAARLAFAVASCEGSGLRNGLGDFTFTRDREWVDAIDLNYCPFDEIAQRQTFEVQLTPATAAELTLGH